MKRFLALAAALVFLAVCSIFWIVPASARDRVSGEVLYHQDFSVLSDLAKSGIVRGTSSSENSDIACDGDVLKLNTFDKQCVYAILPSVERGDSYTIEFDFAFSEIRSDNGYIGLILTCRGSEPTNITSLVIRANGTVDDFKESPTELAKKISGGEKIHIKVPIEKNVLHTIELTAGDVTYVLERDSVKVIDEGSMGFGVRNASVQVGEVYIVNGTGYADKTGAYAVESYASDGIPVTVEIVDRETEDRSPETGERFVPSIVALAAIGMGLFIRNVSSMSSRGKLF